MKLRNRDKLKLKFSKVLDFELPMLIGTLIFILLFTSFETKAEPLEIPMYKNAEFARLSSLECAALNLYHESRSESDMANVMVMAVVLNRVNDSRYPDTICEVVFQPKQYSWTHDKLSDKVYNKEQYLRLYKLVEKVMLNKEFVLEMSEGVTHYHTTKIHPFWADSLKYVTTLDKHKFYKWE